jgi:hypothetical protein
MVQYLFNSYGEWIAFRDGDSVYEPSGAFLGFVGEDSETVLDNGGRYFATIYGDRLYRDLLPSTSVPRDFNWPRRHESPDPPPSPGFADVPVAAEDVRELAPR